MNFEKEYEYDQGGGATGRWIDRQGIYIYRKGRLIVPGGWQDVRLGNREMEPRERWNRIRIRLDYDGTNDELWKLDVKKTQVRIPALIREKLISKLLMLL